MSAVPVPGEPLRGRRVAVTRSREQSGALAEAVERLGGIAVVTPLIRIGPPSDPAALGEALRFLDRYDWLIFTSANAVRAVADMLRDGSGVRSLPSGIRLATVGPATSASARESGWNVDVEPEAAVGEAVAAALKGRLIGARVLWPRSAIGRVELRDALAANGAEVHDVTAYETRPDAEAACRLASLVAAGEVDAVTFTSPSAVRAYVEAGGGAAGAVVAVIGPVTARAAREAGLPVHIEAGEHTAAGLAEAVAQAFAGTAGA